MKRTRKKLPHDYLNKYLGVELTEADYKFIRGCLHHQKMYFQLNNVQWEIIKKIESKYLMEK